MTTLEFYNMSEEQYNEYIQPNYPYKFKINLDGSVEHMFNISTESPRVYSYENLMKALKGNSSFPDEVFIKQYYMDLVRFEYILAHQEQILKIFKTNFTLREFAIQTNPELLI